MLSLHKLLWNQRFFVSMAIGRTGDIPVANSDQQWLIGIPLVGVETTCFLLLQAAAERMLEATPEADLALAGFPSSWEEPQMFGKPKAVWVRCWYWELGSWWISHFFFFAFLEVEEFRYFGDMFFFYIFL